MARILPFILCILFLACTDTSEESDNSEFAVEEETTEIDYNEVFGGYEIIEGQQLFEEDTVILFLRKNDFSIVAEINSRLGEDYEFPIIDGELADHLTLSSIIICEGQTLDGRSIEGEMIRNSLETNYRIGPESLTKFSPGNYMFELEVNSDLQTIYGHSSGISPIQFKIKFDYDVQTIYRTKIEFIKLQLDKEQLHDSLLWNDFVNRTPETGFKAIFNGVELLDGWTKNSYTFAKYMDTIFYHSSLNDSLIIEATDEDYGFNKDDLISYTKVSIGDLVSDTYVNIPLKYAKECLVRCTVEGPLNP